jgi:2-oxoglutarate dehydrogenase E1 component
MKTTFRKPLIVFTPKSLLRDPRCSFFNRRISKWTFQESLMIQTVNKKALKHWFSVQENSIMTSLPKEKLW